MNRQKLEAPGSMAVQIFSAHWREDLWVSEELDGTVKLLKQQISAKIGCSRFRQRLFEMDDLELDDDMPLANQPSLRLVKLEFCTPDSLMAREFVSACENNRIIEVEKTLQRPLNPNLRDSRTGLRAIHPAASQGHLKVLQLLLESEADADAPMEDGQTALHLNSRFGHLEVVQLLLKSGANKDASMEHGWNALHYASYYGHFHVVQLLLESEADADAPTEDGQTALHLASQNGRWEVVQLLLQSEATERARGLGEKQHS